MAIMASKMVLTILLSPALCAKAYGPIGVGLLRSLSYTCHEPRNRPIVLLNCDILYQLADYLAANLPI